MATPLSEFWQGVILCSNGDIKIKGKFYALRNVRFTAACAATQTYR